jgi:hypothetical protein
MHDAHQDQVERLSASRHGGEGGRFVAPEAHEASVDQSIDQVESQSFLLIAVVAGALLAILLVDLLL